MKAARAFPATCTAPRPDRFGLTGPTRTLDPRINAYRRDIADIGLASQVFAPHYARPLDGSLLVASAPIRAIPADDGQVVTQLMHGEAFAVLDEIAGWAWGQCLHDGYVGYVPADAIGSFVAATACIVAPLALIFAEPDIKAPVIGSWPIGARFASVEVGDFFAAGDGFIHRRHAMAIDVRERDPVSVAERLIGLPYLWGGRGAGGIDCSGLVQVAFGMCGIDVPRDSDQQRQAAGDELSPDVPLQRGDLIFFPGHVGMMVDRERMIHANAHWMGVTVEPLVDVVARLGDDSLIARRRINA